MSHTLDGLSKSDVRLKSHPMMPHTPPKTLEYEYVWHASFVCETCVVYVWHASFVWGTCVNDTSGTPRRDQRTCDMFHSHVKHVCDMTHSHVQHVCDVTHSYAQ